MQLGLVVAFNPRFTTKPTIERGDEPEVTKSNLSDISDKPDAAGARSPADGEAVSESSHSKSKKERVSVIAAGGVLLLSFYAYPEALLLGIVGRSVIQLVTPL